jgi:S1-C subfamily serine protease
MESRTKPDRGNHRAASRRRRRQAAGSGRGLLLLVLVLLLLFLGGVVLVQATAAASKAAGRVKTGTGFFVSHDGFLVTSAHVIAGCDGVAVWEGGIERRDGRIVAADHRRDIALLSTDGEAAHIAAASDRSSPHVGEATFGLDFGVSATQPRTPMFSRGIFVGDDVTPTGDPVLVIRAHVPEGASGAPVLDADGSLVGMVIGYFTERPNLGVVVPSADIDAFLAAHGLVLTRGRPITGVGLSPDDLLLKISALVQCVPPPASKTMPAHGRKPPLP